MYLQQLTLLGTKNARIYIEKRGLLRQHFVTRGKKSEIVSLDSGDSLKEI